jgi:hypothetical protein
MELSSSTRTGPQQKAARRLGIWICVAIAAAVPAAFAPATIALTALVSLAAAIVFDIRRAAAVGASGWLAVAGSALAWSGRSQTELIAVGAFAVAAGLMAGSSRHRARNSEPPAVVTEEADVREGTAVARDAYDALAGSLDALSAHLDAADAVLESGGDLEEAEELLRRARALASRGIHETAALMEEHL